jgi:dihydrodipicolinate reductase
MIKAIVNGSCGQMGSTVVTTAWKPQGIQLIAGIAKHCANPLSQ